MQGPGLDPVVREMKATAAKLQDVVAQRRDAANHGDDDDKATTARGEMRDRANEGVRRGRKGNGVA